MKRASDVMSYDLISLTRERLAYHAYFKMDESHLRHLPIVDHEGHLIGIVSDRDLKKRMYDAFNPEAESFNDIEFMLTEVGDVMTPNPVFAYEDTDLYRITDMMLTHRISSIVIVTPDSRKPVGIVTSTDMLGLLREHLRPKL